MDRHINTIKRLIKTCQALLMSQNVMAERYENSRQG
jgi:hypothetical protein